MDSSTIWLFAIAAVLVAACIVIFLIFYNAMRRAGSEGRKRQVARCALLNWVAMGVLAPVLVLSALGVLAAWISAVAIIAACAVTLWAAHYVRRSTMRTQV